TAALRPAEIKKLIARLSSRQFREREAAAQALKDLGPDAEGCIKEELAAKPTLELRRRLEDILAVITWPAATQKTIRSARAVEVLERIGTAEARNLLRRLAGGRPGHPLTEDAKATLCRLAPPR